MAVSTLLRSEQKWQCWIALLQLPAEWWVDQVAANLWVGRASLRSQTGAGVFATRLQGSMPTDVKTKPPLQPYKQWESYGQHPRNHPKPIENTKIHSCNWRQANQKSRRKTDLTRDQSGEQSEIYVSGCTRLVANSFSFEANGEIRFQRSVHLLALPVPHFGVFCGAGA